MEHTAKTSAQTVPVLTDDSDGAKHEARQVAKRSTLNLVRVEPQNTECFDAVYAFGARAGFGELAMHIAWRRTSFASAAAYIAAEMRTNKKRNS